MEVKINHEIRNYTESVFFGLSLRQLLCSILAVIIALIIYFSLKPYANTEIVSWLCVAGTFPLIALGFFKYNGMPAEKFIIAWIKSLMLSNRELTLEIDEDYY